MSREISVKVPKEFQDYAEVAAMRLRYIFPAWEVASKTGAILLRNISPDAEREARREVTYALYRERIRSEGAPLRELLLKTMVA